MSPAAEKHRYIDALRGIAVLLVILTHSAQPVAGLPELLDGLAKCGQTGVQLFFVASAYTLCLSFRRRGAEARPVLSFYLRRLFRIAPLYWLAIAVYFGLHLALQLKGAPATLVFAPYTAFNVMANALFVHGFVPAANNSIVPGGWSIGTEMAFYALFPLLFALAGRLHRKGLAALLLAWALLCIGNLALQMALEGTRWAVAGNNFTYFNIVNQLPVFGIGLLAYFVNEEGVAARLPPAWYGLGCLVFAALTLLLWGFEQPLLFALIPSSAALSFLCLLQLLRVLPLKLNALCRAGQVSYSMYVFHFLFAWYAVPAGVAPLALPPALSLALSFALTLAGTFTVAVWSERWVEARGVALGRRCIARLQAGATPSREKQHAS